MYTRDINLSGYYDVGFTYTYNHILNRIRMLSQYHLSTFKDEKTGEPIIELLMSADEESFIKTEIKNALVDIGNLFFKTKKGGDSAYFTKSNTTTFGIAANDYGYVTYQLLYQLDEIITEEIALWVLKEWYGLKAPKEKEPIELAYQGKKKIINNSLYYFLKRKLTFIKATEAPTPPYVPTLIIMFYMGEFATFEDFQGLENTSDGSYVYCTSLGSYYAHAEGSWHVVTKSEQIEDCILLKQCYGVTWNIDDEAAAVTAIGNMAYHNTLPFHIFERGIVTFNPSTSKNTMVKTDPVNSYMLDGGQGVLKSGQFSSCPNQGNVYTMIDKLNLNDIVNKYIHNVSTDEYAKIIGLGNGSTIGDANGELIIDPVRYIKVNEHSYGTKEGNIGNPVPPQGSTGSIHDSHAQFLTWKVKVGDLVGYYNNTSYVYDRIIQIDSEWMLWLSGGHTITNGTKYTIYRNFAHTGESFDILSTRFEINKDKYSDFASRIKKLYYTDFITSDNRYVVLISDQHLSQLKPFECFLNSNGSENDYIYPGAYKGYIYDSNISTYNGNEDGYISNNVGCSCDNVLPIAGVTKATVRPIVALWNKKLNDIFTQAFLTIMQVIEFKTRDIASVPIFGGNFPYGEYEENIRTFNNGFLKPILKTGLTNKLGNRSGYVLYEDTRNGVTINTAQVSYRGIEGFIGDIGEMVDGINIFYTIQDSAIAYVCTNDNLFADDTMDNYSNAGVLPIANTFIKGCGGLANAGLPATQQINSPSASKYWASRFEEAWSDRKWYCPVISGKITTPFTGLKYMNVSMNSAMTDPLVGFRIVHKSSPFARTTEQDNGDSTYTKSFTNVCIVVVEHYLGKYPTVTVKDEQGNEIEVDVDYNSLDVCTLSWNGLASGTVTCN